MSNLRTFGDLKGEKKDNKEGQNRQSYVGGEKSGLLVEDDRGSILDKIVNKAKEEAEKNKEAKPEQ